MTSARRLLPALASGLVVAALLAGCEGEPIRSYSVPRQEEDLTGGKVRLLAAIVPVEGETWFFKMVGRSDIIAMTEPAFREVIDSLEFPKGGDKVRWKAPKGWTEDRQAKKGMVGERKGTLKPEGAPGPVLTIDTLGGGAAANVKMNVDRWRRNDLGLGPISGRSLEKVATRRTIKGRDVTLVDLTGPGAEKKATIPKRPPGHPGRPRESKGLKFDLPVTWKQVRGSMMAYATFEMRDGRDVAQMKITRIGGKALLGGFKPNLDRWRADVGLPPSAADELAKSRPRPIKIGGAEGRRLDIPARDRLLRVAWVEHGGATWYFKLLGPTALVKRELGHFDRFLEKLTFTGAADE